MSGATKRAFSNFEEGVTDSAPRVKRADRGVRRDDVPEYADEVSDGPHDYSDDATSDEYIDEGTEPDSGSQFDSEPEAEMEIEQEEVEEEGGETSPTPTPTPTPTPASVPALASKTPVKKKPPTVGGNNDPKDDFVAKNHVRGKGATLQCKFLTYSKG